MALGRPLASICDRQHKDTSPWSSHASRLIGRFMEAHLVGMFQVPGVIQLISFSRLSCTASLCHKGLIVSGKANLDGVEFLDRVDSLLSYSCLKDCLPCPQLVVHGFDLHGNCNLVSCLVNLHCRSVVNRIIGLFMQMSITLLMLNNF